MSGGRSDSDNRPDPDELLDRYQLRDQPVVSEESEGTPSSGAGVGGRSARRRGRLRIYLGMAAGVGKTYAMLNEGRRRASRGADVVVGYVETHHRPLTERQIGDLEVIPRKRIEYRGVMLEEMDLDAVLARNPAVALVDELAHTNAPGSRHAKRYEDVEELLAAGVTVITTLNVQHLEGLNDIVESITGVTQRETAPDRLLDEADEVELVDISPEALRSRLRHGNVYAPERAEKALQNYFSISNLTALRELALRRTAEKTETQLEHLMIPGTPAETRLWGGAATERVLVAFDGQPRSRQLLRSGWRLARGLKAPLLAATVASPAGDAGSEKALADMARLAEDLGAEVVRLNGANVAEELAGLARARHITQIVIGQSERRSWRDALRGSLVDRLLRAGAGAELHVVPDRRQRDDE
ncbi:MAG TPA: universal stress protein [Ktedonobacterales bacterium]|nr:universal stress protein [Ktedonobacterales bacterium]